MIGNELGAYHGILADVVRKEGSRAEADEEREPVQLHASDLTFQRQPLQLFSVLRRAKGRREEGGSGEKGEEGNRRNLTFDFGLSFAFSFFVILSHGLLEISTRQWPCSESGKHH